VIKLSQIRVIAVEIPFLISFQKVEPVQACVYKEGKVFIYNLFGNTLCPKNYSEYINTVDHAVKEGKYEWSDFYIEEGKIITIT
jgi:hypothetical protein